jgi:hypothetical protein
MFDFDGEKKDEIFSLVVSENLLINKIKVLFIHLVLLDMTMQKFSFLFSSDNDVS